MILEFAVNLLKIVEDEVKHESAVMIKEMESRAKEEADKKAGKIDFL